MRVDFGIFADQCAIDIADLIVVVVCETYGMVQENLAVGFFLLWVGWWEMLADIVYVQCVIDCVGHGMYADIGV